MTTENALVNSYGANYSPTWTLVGASPYLDAGVTSYIYLAGSVNNGRKCGNFGFPSSAGSGTIVSVQIQFMDEIASMNSKNAYHPWLYDGSAWHDLGVQVPETTSWALNTAIDVSSILSSWAKINAASLYVVFVGADSYSLGIAEGHRIVNYTPPSAAAPPSMVGDGLTYIISRARRDLNRRFPAFRPRRVI
jgi:hypothetical protein